MLCDVVIVVGRTHLRIHAASHVAWVSISMHACVSAPIVMVLCLAALWAAGALLLFVPKDNRNS